MRRGSRDRRVVDHTPGFQWSKVLFVECNRRNQYAVTEDGLKFLVLEPRKGFLETYSVVLNWRATVT